MPTIAEIFATPIARARDQQRARYDSDIRRAERLQAASEALTNEQWVSACHGFSVERGDETYDALIALLRQRGRAVQRRFDWTQIESVYVTEASNGEEVLLSAAYGLHAGYCVIDDEHVGYTSALVTTAQLVEALRRK